MSPRDRDPGFRADGIAASQDFPHVFDGELAKRHPENSQRHQRLAAHRVDIRNRIRRGDPAEVEGIVNHGHEKVCRRDNAGVVIDAPHSRVVARFGPYEEPGKLQWRLLSVEQFLKNGRRKFAPAAAAMSQCCETSARRAHS